VVLFLKVFQSKCIHFSFLSCVLYDPHLMLLDFITQITLREAYKMEVPMITRSKAEALSRADPLSAESYQMSKIASSGVSALN
jgi:hypothetical protein